MERSSEGVNSKLTNALRFTEERFKRVAGRRAERTPLVRDRRGGILPPLRFNGLGGKMPPLRLASFGPACGGVPFSWNVLSFPSHAVTKRHELAGHSALEIE